MTSTARLLLQSARVAELKAAAELVKPRPAAQLPRDPKLRARLLAFLLAAERRRSAELISQLR